MPKHRTGLGSEHPLCDSVQIVMLILFFVALGVDSLGHFMFGISTVFVEFTSFPFLLVPAVLSLISGVYLALKSHDAVFGETAGQLKLIDSGVYSLVRHPMYLGTLLFCLGFFLVIPSLISMAVWIAFFLFYDKMATYEENDLRRIFGTDYTAYQKRVPKWFPGAHQPIFRQKH
jgi:protein-S-isoprenylcysteine O-methyltransferase Ste14